ncbi:MAG: protein translocase subunit SecF [Patescibacteria group bacterium]
MVQVTRYRKIYYIFSGTLIVLSLIALAVWGLELGVDFKGGSMLYGTFTEKALSVDEINSAVAQTGIGEAVVQPSGERDVFIRFNAVDEDMHQKVLAGLAQGAQQAGEGNSFVEKSFDSIGPSIGKELRSKSVIAIFIVLALVIGYIALVFRKVSYPLASWKYGIATLVALFHDVIIPVGLFAVLGHFAHVEITGGFIAAILTVLGYSVHDSIIVFDRIRENLMRHQGKTFEETVNISVNQTFVRSLNTSLTVILVLLAIYLIGGESVKYIALALMVGVGVGTYSSIFIGSTLLVSWYAWMQKKQVQSAGA